MSCLDSASKTIRDTIGITFLLDCTATDKNYKYHIYGADHACAENWYQGKADSDTCSNESTKPITGLFYGTLGTLASLVKLVAGAILMAVTLIACCFCCGGEGVVNLFIFGTLLTLTGAVMLVAYPCMMVYGHTIGWFECVYKACPRQEYETIN